MNRIMIDVSQAELDYMREALEHKHISLMAYLDVCEADARPKPTWEEVSDIAEEEFEKEFEAIQPKRTIKAPYGLKKDGTPAKKRGRK
jgi:hypothetical protein